MDTTNNVKQNILSAALKLFSEKGYEGTSVSELVLAAGITKPTLYYYFGSKEGLFDAVCQNNYTHLNNAISKKAVYNANPEMYYEDIFKTLTNAASAYFSFASGNEVFYRLTMSNLYTPKSSSVFDMVQKYHLEQYGIIGRMFISMSEYHSNLRDKDKRLAWSFIGAINAYISLAFSGISESLLDEDLAKELVHQFMHGIYA